MIKDISKLSLELLIKEIEHHNYLYWQKNSPEISDEDYDALMQRLEELDPSHKLLSFVGSIKRNTDQSINLEDPMISLEKTYYFKDAPKGKKSLLQWINEISRSDEEIFLVQPKYDGVSACFSNSVLATRGQGSDDENISDKVPLVELETTGYKGPLNKDVRGEIIIRNDDFLNIYSRIIRSDGSTYKNQRNAVAGIIGLKDFSDIQRQGGKLTLVDYLLISFKVSKKDFSIKWEKIVSEIESLPYPMDGVVVKLFDDKYSKSLGSTAHHPRGQIAFKFSGVRKESKIIDIDWSFGKNCLTPIARIEPVEIGGVTIRNVTLDNLANIEEKDIQIGDTVLVERAGDVIPHIVRSESGLNRKSGIIDRCPSCGSILVRDSKELRCFNPECSGSNLQRILASVRNIGIEELGEPNIEKMMKHLNVKTLKDIFDLTISDILKLDGFQIRSAKNLYDNVQKARNAEDFALLASLNIPGVGKNVAEKILKDYRLEELKEKTSEELSCIPSIGIEISSNLYKSLRDKKYLLNELIDVLNIIPTKPQAEPYILVSFDADLTTIYSEEVLKANGYNRVKLVRENGEYIFPRDLKFFVSDKKLEPENKLKKTLEISGVEIISSTEFNEKLKNTKSDIKRIKKICFTGAMPQSRTFYESIAIKNGYKPVEIVTKELDILVISDISLNSSKLVKANGLGITVKTLTDWLTDIGISVDELKAANNSQTEEEECFLPGFE